MRLFLDDFSCVTGTVYKSLRPPGRGCARQHAAARNASPRCVPSEPDPTRLRGRLHNLQSAEERCKNPQPLPGHQKEQQILRGSKEAAARCLQQPCVLVSVCERLFCCSLAPLAPGHLARRGTWPCQELYRVEIGGFSERSGCPQALGRLNPLQLRRVPFPTLRKETTRLASWLAPRFYVFLFIGV